MVCQLYRNEDQKYFIFLDLYIRGGVTLCQQWHNFIGYYFTFSYRDFSCRINLHSHIHPERKISNRICNKNWRILLSEFKFIPVNFLSGKKNNKRRKQPSDSLSDNQLDMSGKDDRDRIPFCDKDRR